MTEDEYQDAAKMAAKMTEAEQEREKVIRYVRAQAAELRIWALFKDYSAAYMFEELADEIKQGEHLK